MTSIRTRWAAIGAAVTVSVGAGGIGISNAATSSGDRPVLTAIRPCRITDTRPDQKIGDKTTAFGKQETHTIKVLGSNGQCTAIPDDVTAVELNVTAVGATEPTFLTIWDTGPVPNASSLNPVPGQPPIPNAVTVNLSDDGTFNVFNLQGDVHLIIDVVGIYQPHNHDDRYYTKEQIDAAFPTGNAPADVYTKAEVDAAVAGKVHRKQTLVIPPSAFQTIESQLPAVNHHDLGAWIDGGDFGLHGFVAPLELPAGSLITKITYDYIDNSLTQGMSFELVHSRRGTLVSNGLAPFNTTGASSAVRSGVRDDVPVRITADAIWAIRVQSSAWHAVKDQLRLKGVSVEYTLP